MSLPTCSSPPDGRTPRISPRRAIGTRFRVVIAGKVMTQPLQLGLQWSPKQGPPSHEIPPIQGERAPLANMAFLTASGSVKTESATSSKVTDSTRSTETASPSRDVVFVGKSTPPNSL
jgi:hypothetical protein